MESLRFPERVAPQVDQSVMYCLLVEAVRAMEEPIPAAAAAVPVDRRAQVITRPDNPVHLPSQMEVPVETGAVELPVGLRLLALAVAVAVPV